MSGSRDRRRGSPRGGARQGGASGRHGGSWSASSPTPYPRTARVNTVLHEVLAEQLERLSDTDDRLRLATVTGVETSPDLRHATVFVGHLDDALAEALGERRRELQRAVATQVRLKRTPLLEFAADPAVASGERVEEILRHIEAAAPGPGTPEGPDGPDGSEGSDGSGNPEGPSADG